MILINAYYISKLYFNIDPLIFNEFFIYTIIYISVQYYYIMTKTKILHFDIFYIIYHNFVKIKKILIYCNWRLILFILSELIYNIGIILKTKTIVHLKGLFK